MAKLLRADLADVDVHAHWLYYNLWAFSPGEEASRTWRDARATVRPRPTRRRRRWEEMVGVKPEE